MDLVGKYMVTKIKEGKSEIPYVIQLIYAHINLHEIYFHHEPYFHDGVLLTVTIGDKEQHDNFLKTINTVAAKYNCKMEQLLLKDYVEQ